MKLRSSLILIVGALLLSCATVGPQSAPLLCNETPFFIDQPAPEQTFVSGIQYYLDDIYDYDEVFLITQPIVKQPHPRSGVQYYLYFDDIYDYDEAFLISQHVTKQTPFPEAQYYLNDIYDYDEIFFITQPIVRETLFAGIQYHLDNLYDYDETFPLKPVVEQTLFAEIQCSLDNLYDYDETFPLRPAVGHQIIASGIQYYLEDIYQAYALPDYFAVLSRFNENLFPSKEAVAEHAPKTGPLPDYFAILSKFNDDPFLTVETAPEQIMVSGIQ